MGNVQTGYMGIANISTLLGSTIDVRCTDFNINVQQNATFYDHVIGLNDTIPVGPDTKGEVPGTIQTQKKYWRPSPIIIQGGMSFPATYPVLSGSGTSSEMNFQTLFNYAKYGNYFDLDFKYFCGGGRLFTNCRVNNFSLSVMAADIVNITVDIMAKDMVDSDTVVTRTASQKLVTWDKVELLLSGDLGGISDTNNLQGFDFSINNNIQAIHTANPSTVTNKLLPSDLRIGMQEVTGTLYIYKKQGPDFLSALTSDATMSLTIGTFTTPIYAIIEPRQIAGAIGPIILNVPFVGIDKAFGA